MFKLAISDKTRYFNKAYKLKKIENRYHSGGFDVDDFFLLPVRDKLVSSELQSCLVTSDSFNYLWITINNQNMLPEWY